MTLPQGVTEEMVRECLARAVKECPECHGVMCSTGADSPVIPGRRCWKCYLRGCNIGIGSNIAAEAEAERLVRERVEKATTCEECGGVMTPGDDPVARYCWTCCPIEKTSLDHHATFAAEAWLRKNKPTPVVVDKPFTAAPGNHITIEISGARASGDGTPSTWRTLTSQRTMATVFGLPPEEVPTPVECCDHGVRRGMFCNDCEHEHAHSAAMECECGKGIVDVPCFSQWPPKPQEPMQWSLDPDDWGR